MRVPADFPSLAFFERVRIATAADPAFRRGTEFFDGSVMLEVGEFAVWMKWYRGRIIEIHEGADPLGYTFALRAPVATWRGIWELPRTAMTPWARLFNYGEIATDGNAVAAGRVLQATFALVAQMEAEGGER